MMRNLIAASAVVALAGASAAQVLAFQSFQESSVSDGEYVDARTNGNDGGPGGTPLNIGDTIQLDSALGNQIDWARTGSLADSEMSFDAFFTFNNQNTVLGVNGFSDGDFLGITSFSPVNPGPMMPGNSGFGPDGAIDSGDEPFPDGNRGYQMQSTDGGFMTLVFEEVNFAGPNWFFTMDYDFDETGWENAGNNIDFFNIILEVDGGSFGGGEDIVLVSLFGDDIEAGGLDNLDFIEAAQDLSGFSSARLIIEFQANETVWIDDIQFVEGVIPAPGALAAFGVAGLAATRRRR